MDDHGKHLREAGICHRLLYFFMRSLATQATKPVILGTPVIHQRTRREARCGISLVEGGEDSERLVSIDIEDETCALLSNKGDGCRADVRKLLAENGTKTKPPRKMVSIKDEPEIIHPNMRRRKNERQMLGGNEVGVRPLKSILKVGSKLRETSVQIISPKPTPNTIIS